MLSVTLNTFVNKRKNNNNDCYSFRIYQLQQRETLKLKSIFLKDSPFVKKSNQKPI
jgi:hypothetical protein